MLVDTHSSAVIDPVCRLLGSVYSLNGVFPTLLEQDSNTQSFANLELELQQIIQIQELALSDKGIQTATETSF